MKMMTRSAVDQRLLGALLRYAETRDHPDFEPFMRLLRDWGDQWTPVEPQHFAASDTLAAAADKAIPAAREMVAEFVEFRHRCRWRQTYTREDGLVGDDMLSNYGYVEVVGPNGPFVSEKLRCGLFLLGPDITYPAHRHAPAEIYDIVAGDAIFFIGEQSEVMHPRIYRAGEHVYIQPNQRHGFATGDDPFVVFYFHAGEDLVSKSRFD